MKLVLIIIPLIALLAVGIAGPLVMLNGSGHAAGCPVAAVAQLPCLSLGTITNHIAALQGLLTAVPVSTALGLLVVFGFLAFLFASITAVAPLRPIPVVIPKAYPDVLRSRWMFIRWQARLVHSPTAA